MVFSSLKIGKEDYGCGKGRAFFNAEGRRKKIRGLSSSSGEEPDRNS
jgi:hypothetical protein